MVPIVLGLAWLMSQAGANVEQDTCTHDDIVTIQPSADAIIGGILSLHYPGTDGSGCGELATSMQSYEALRYALNLVNKKDEFENGMHLTDYYVPGIRLGMAVVDYCGNSTAAVASLSHVFPGLDSHQPSCTPRANLTLGVIGASDSGATAELAKPANSFHIPVISYSASAVNLTSSGDNSNFLRTIPPDNQLMEVMAQVAKELQWNYVAVVYEDSDYGHEAINTLQPALTSMGICLTAVYMATDPADSAVRAFLQQVVGGDAVGTIFLGGANMAKSILRNGMDVEGGGRLQWLFTDSISLEHIFPADQTYHRGIFTLVPASRYIVEFEDHWVSIDEEMPSAENPWYKQWFQDNNQCDLADSNKYRRPCSSVFPADANTRERQKRENFIQSQSVEPALHAVFAYARALRDAQQNKCGQGFSGICSQLRNMTHDDFLNNYLKKVDFVYTSQERVPSLASDYYAPFYAAKHLKFDARGDIVNRSFSLWNYNDLSMGEENSTFMFREVGIYINGTLTLKKSSIRMYNTLRTAPLPAIPASPCPTSGCSPCLGVTQNMKYYYQPGHVVINGVFSLHEEGAAKFKCGGLISTGNPLYLEAMIYAVEEVNKRSDILRGITLGGLGIDDCMDAALSTNFIMEVQSGMFSVQPSDGSTLDPGTVEAYIAAYNSPLSLPLASLMDRFMQPMVGYRASSEALDKHHYYVKTQPGLEQELRAMVMILRTLHWNYTQFIHDPSYTPEDAHLFRRLAAREGICVVATHLFAYDNMSAITALRRLKTVRPVVLLFSSETHRSFLRVLNASEIWTDFDFIATSSFHQDANIAEGLERAAQGYISIDISYSKLCRFYNFLDAHNVNSYSWNSWFREWYQASYNCWLVDSERGNYTTQCTSANRISSGPMFRKDKNIIHVINAVYAIAEGLDKVISSYCSAGYDGLCSQFLMANRSNRGNKLLEEILKVSFNIEDTNPTEAFKFEDRSGAHTFSIYRYENGQNQLWCLDGHCVFNRSEVKNDCILGDDPNSDCAQLVRSSNPECYESYVVSRCSSCKTVKRPVPGCEYGDRVSGCSATDCSNVSRHSDCCQTCDFGTPVPNTTTANTTTTPPTTKTTVTTTLPPTTSPTLQTTKTTAITILPPTTKTTAATTPTPTSSTTLPTTKASATTTRSATTSTVIKRTTNPSATTSSITTTVSPSITTTSDARTISASTGFRVSAVAPLQASGIACAFSTIVAFLLGLDVCSHSLI